MRLGRELLWEKSITLLSAVKHWSERAEVIASVLNIVHNKR